MPKADHGLIMPEAPSHTRRALILSAAPQAVAAALPAAVIAATGAAAVPETPPAPAAAGPEWAPSDLGLHFMAALPGYVAACWLDANTVDLKKHPDYDVQKCHLCEKLRKERAIRA